MKQTTSEPKSELLKAIERKYNFDRKAKHKEKIAIPDSSSSEDALDRFNAEHEESDISRFSPTQKSLDEADKSFSSVPSLSPTRNLLGYDHEDMSMDVVWTLKKYKDKKKAAHDGVQQAHSSRGSGKKKV